ncbi:CPBP family intramembrane glutamic endopeptidase [Sorangium sp. So ce1078]|uniref:CPBP family intramembrane glutamic endopeptidase n=1 Tax=Sorangium sp. So ce1078 TaxID=3133329 RepID=UPI003F5FE3C8
MPPPSAHESSWHGLRRLLVLYALLLAASALLALLRALEVAPGAALDAFVAGVSGLLVMGFALRDRRKVLPLLDPRNLRLDNAAAIAAGAALTVLALEAYFFLLAALDVPLMHYWSVFEEAGWPLWSAFVLIAAVPAVVEEVAFRGLIYEGLSRVMTRREALLVQAMAFSVLHLSPWVFASHFLIGFSLGMLRDATRSLYPCMLAHAAWNAWVVAEESGLLGG